MLENRENLMQCECGSVLFNEIKAKTYIDNRFIFYGDALKSSIQNEDISIPIALCIFCGKVHIPRTSFSGMNQMNRHVQVYAELLEFEKAYNSRKALPDPVISLPEPVMAPEEVIVEDTSVSAKQDSVTDIKDVVRDSRTRGKSIKNNKK
jgi:hypothetical protein